jgi:hypothetical protein
MLFNLKPGEIAVTLDRAASRTGRIRPPQTQRPLSLLFNNLTFLAFAALFLQAHYQRRPLWRAAAMAMILWMTALLGFFSGAEFIYFQF